MTGEAAAPPRTETPTRGHPNVLLLTIDALRVDVAQRERGSPLGGWQPPTPHLDSLRSVSAVFPLAYSPSSGTTDTFGSLFAGAQPPGILQGVPDDQLLPVRLERAGYTPGAFVNDSHFLASGWGWATIDRRKGETRAMLEDVVNQLDQPGPSFVWFHFLDIHASVLNPFSPASYSRDSELGRYARGLAHVDAHLGWLLGAIRERGLDQRTLVILSADHGEEMGEHGHFHHNLTLYEPAVRVPLWVTGPGVSPGARGSIVPLIDVYPTIAETAGLDPGSTSGQSLWPTLADPAVEAEERLMYLFLARRGFSQRFSWWSLERGQASIVDPQARRKIILRLDQESIEYYDLAQDPGEQENLAGRNLAWMGPLRASLDSALAVHGRRPSQGSSLGIGDDNTRLASTK